MAVLKEIIPGITTWSEFSEEKQLDFNGYYVVRDGQAVIIDPPRLDDAGLQELQSLIQKNSTSPLKAILLTNVHHDRMSQELKQQLSVPVFIHEKDKPLLEFEADGTFQDGDACFGLKVLHLENQKSPGESAFLWEDRKILIVGDALIGKVPGQVHLLPPDKYQDIGKAREGLKRLQEVDFETLLVGDGRSLLSGAKTVVLEFLKG